jgi:CRISPR-associated protein Cas1
MAAVDSRESLLGLEGAATRAYFSAWPALLSRSEPSLQFMGRTRRPPQDAVNALLSFTYSLLQKDVHAACIIAGLDPYLGVLHVPRRTLPAMVLDLMEAFRPVVADSVVLALLNRGAFQSRHAEPRDEGVYLTEAGRKLVYKAYGRRRSDTITLPGMGRSLPYYRAYELQARRMAAALEGKATDYQAFRMR